MNNEAFAQIDEEILSKYGQPLAEGQQMAQELTLDNQALEIGRELHLADVTIADDSEILNKYAAPPPEMNQNIEPEMDME